MPPRVAAITRAVSIIHSPKIVGEEHNTMVEISDISREVKRVAIIYNTGVKPSL